VLSLAEPSIGSPGAAERSWGDALVRRVLPNVEALEGKSLLSPLAVTLTTNRHCYRSGAVVRMTLTETNVSGQDVTVGIGPSVDGFAVACRGVRVWSSTAQAVPELIAERTLAPGQSLTVCARWLAPRASGIYRVTNQAAPNGPVARFRIVDR
jgi:hypothetical protein